MVDIRSLWALGLTGDCHAEADSDVKRERKALPLARDPAVGLLASLPRLYPLHLVLFPILLLTFYYHLSLIS